MQKLFTIFTLVFLVGMLVACTPQEVVTAPPPLPTLDGGDELPPELPLDSGAGISPPLPDFDTVPRTQTGGESLPPLPPLPTLPN